MNKLFMACAFVVLVALSAGAAAASPAVADTYAYRVSNAYNREVIGETTYRIDQLDADRVSMSVTANTPAMGPARTEIYTRDGNWLRHPVTNHDQPVEYEFAQAYPAYQFPLDTGKSWSVRVNATNPVTGRRNSVRVDAEVVGAERISVPAGNFETIKVRRRVYAGDFDGSRRETQIVETDWYAPALGRAVRSESNSAYLDLSRGGGDGFAGMWVSGDWNTFELVNYSSK